MTSSNGHERAGAAQYDAEGGNFRIMMGGDVMLTRRLAVYREPRYLALRDLLQQADAVFGNFESTAHDYASAVPMAMPTGGGTYMVTQPELLQDLKWLGVNLLSTANNHSCDYGNEGILANMQHLSAAGIAYAGTGRHLREARAPGYLDTAAGRVGLVAASAYSTKATSLWNNAWICWASPASAPSASTGSTALPQPTWSTSSSSGNISG